MELFICAHQNYDYEKLCKEIESLQREEEDSIADFDSRIIHNSYRFHDDDRPSKEDFDLLRLYVIPNSLYKVHQWIFLDDLDSTQLEYFDHEDNKIEPHILFLEPISIPLAEDVVIPTIDSIDGNEITHEASHSKPMVNSNPPLSIYGVNGVTNEFELPSMLGPHSPQPCSDQEEIIVPQTFDPPSNDKNMVNNVTNLVGLHYTLGFYGVSTCDHMDEDVIHEDTDHSLEYLSILTSIFKE